MRTRAKGNVIDAISYELAGAKLANNEPVLGSIATPDGNGAGVPAFIVAGDQTYLFPVGRTFTVTGGSNPGSYTVTAPGAVYNTFPLAPHILNTTEIPAAVTVDVSGADGTISGYGIDLDFTFITNSAEPVLSSDVATKNYVDTTPASSLAPGTYSINIIGNVTGNVNGTLDGLDSSQFLRSDTNDTLQDGTLTVQSATTRYVSFNDQAGTQNPGVRMLTAGSSNAGALVDNVNSVANGYLRLYRYTAGGGFASQINLFEDGNITIDPAGTTTNAGNFNVTGAIVATGNITAFSDIRLKEDIRTIGDAMDKIVQIGGYTFTRNDLEDDEKRHVGVIAQEVQHVLPEAVETSEDGTLSVAYGNLVALLIEGMKEQRKEILDLKKRLDDLED